jgi:hypothetical protein
VRSAARLSLVDDLSATFEVGGEIDLVRAHDHLYVLRAGLGDGADHPIDHRAAAYRMEDLWSARPHAGAVTGGEDDGRQWIAQRFHLL